MASTEVDIPIEFLNPARKLEFIAWIKSQHLPSRFSRKLLHDWAKALNVDLNSTDYQLVGYVGHT